MSNSKKNIGLFISQLDNDFSFAVTKGAITASKEKDANLIIFPGRYINAEYSDPKTTEFWYHYNTIFSYANNKNLDYLLVLAGPIGNTVSNDVMKNFLNQYENLPIITISSDIEGFNSIKYDNKKGFYEGITHVVKHHKRKKVGFVSGPLTNEEAAERFDVYKKVLEENNIPYDEKRVVYGNFSEYCREIIISLIDNNPDLDAVCFANDQMAIGGYKVFAEKGINIGTDISVIGFDDSPDAASLIPRLTTVNADAVELGYKAVELCLNKTDFKKVEKIFINSELIIRDLCGCKKYTLDDICTSHCYKDKILDKNSTTITTGRFESYIFENFSTNVYFGSIKKIFNEFISLILSLNKENANDMDIYEKIHKKFNSLFSGNILKYIPYDKIFNVIDFCYCVAIQRINDNNKKTNISFLFLQFYREIATSNISSNNKSIDNIEELNYKISKISQEILAYKTDIEKCFQAAMDTFINLNNHSSYIYLFKEPISHAPNLKWISPKHVLLKAYHNKEEKFTIPYDEQEIDIDYIFKNKYIPKDRPCTLIISPLFSNEEQYGIFISEMDMKYFYFYSSLTIQLSNSLKVINLLNKQATIQNKLQLTLKQIKETNVLLDQISKSDELTKIYNRRGFFEATQSIIKDESNHGKDAIIVFADMDNLKIINDVYGHEDGDFSLIQIANILKDSFRSTDIIGRIGGDEFCVFALLNCKENTENIKLRIKKMQSIANENSNKPYYINMSLGIHAFKCDPHVNLSVILDKADSLLYTEKKNKRKSIYKDSLDNKILDVK